MNAFAKPLVSSVREKGRGSRGSGRGGGRWPRRVPSAFPPRAAAPWDPFLHALYERPAPAERQAPSQPLGGKGEEDGPRGDAEPRKATEDLATPFHLERKRTRPGRGQGPLAAGRGEVSPTTARTEVLSFHATAQGGPRRGPAEPPAVVRMGWEFGGIRATAFAGRVPERREPRGRQRLAPKDWAPDGQLCGTAAGLGVAPDPASQARGPHGALGRVPAAYEVEDKHPGSPEAPLPPKARLRGPRCFPETHCIPERGSSRKSERPAHGGKKFRASGIASKMTHQAGKADPGGGEKPIS